MKGIYWRLILLSIYIITLAYSFYIGRYETIYGVGASGVLIIQIIGLIVFLIHRLLMTLLLKRRKSVLKSIWLSISFLITIHLLMIVGHNIEKYGFNYTIYVPEGYQGRVYLFLSPDVREDVYINDFGVGYIGRKGKARYRIEKGDVDISDAYSTRHENEISIYDIDSTHLTSYSVECFDINDTNEYPQRFSDYRNSSCMVAEEFLEFMKNGLIDETKLYKQAWKRLDKESPWVGIRQE